MTDELVEGVRAKFQEIELLEQAMIEVSLQKQEAQQNQVLLDWKLKSLLNSLQS